MRPLLQITTLFLIIFTLKVEAQTPLTPQEAVSQMTRGINLGNSLDAYPWGETSWGNPMIADSFFTELRKAGFNAVRIPITWGYDGRTSLHPPYTVDSAFMARVDTVVSWALKNGLFVIINAHHEFWLKDTLGDTTWKSPAHMAYVDSAMARFDSIWSQIATHFQSKSDSLIFEILNEPYPIPQADVDKINAQVLKIIRRTNPTRIVSYSGYMWSNSAQLVTAAIPDSSDKYLIGYYHSYDPYPFGLNGGNTSNANILRVITSEMDQVTTWSKKNKIPVVLGEYGFANNCSYNARMYAYATVVDQALRHGIAPFAWDDGGTFAIFNRRSGTFNEIKDILIHTYPQSPTNLSINENPDGSIKLQWQNRDTSSDSIMVQRAVGGTPQNGLSNVNFVNYAKIGPTDSVYTDNHVSLQTSYYYRLSIATNDSTVLQSYPIFLRDSAVTGIGEIYRPITFHLFDNYPNPFNPSTVISYQLPVVSNVSLKVFDVLGREVATIVNEKQAPGYYKVTFDARKLVSGVYFCRLSTPNYVRTLKMLLLK